MQPSFSITVITADSIAGLLNRMLALEPVGTSALMHTGYPCNIDLAELPTFPVDGRGAVPTMGALGLLNHILLEHGSQTIVAAVQDRGERCTTRRFVAIDKAQVGL